MIGPTVAEQGFQYADRAEKAESARLGMWIFLAGETLFFGALVTGFLVYRIGDPAGFAAAGRNTELVFGAVNTAILLTSGAAMFLGVEAAQAAQEAGAGERRAGWPWLALTTALGLAFLTVKGVEWHGDWTKLLVPGLHWSFAGRGRSDEIFMWLYFAMTGIHVVHMIVGVVLVGRLAVLGALGRPASPLVVAMIGLYWGFVDIVWIFLFPLLYLGGRA
ncbi:MAG: cytochrome c oxidase subunit 3 [Janthinobacterium lividum]